MFIDLIAPEHLRGVYYGAQNLSNLGAALGPVMVGFALVHLWPGAIFYLLVLSVLLAGVFYGLGTRKNDVLFQINREQALAYNHGLR